MPALLSAPWPLARRRSSSLLLALLLTTGSAIALTTTALADPAPGPPPAGSTPEKPGPDSPAQDPDSQEDTLKEISAVLAALTEEPAVRSGTVGFYLAPLADAGQPVLTLHPGQSFITASTMKTLTTGSALEILGPDYQFETTLSHDSATGNLIIRGSGDPSLGRPDWDDLFDAWTQALRAAGIPEITGRVIADESAWEPDTLPDGWTWQDIGNYYAPPLTPLTFHDNAFRLYFHLTGKPGDPAGFYDADPWPPNLKLSDQLRIGDPGTGDNAYLYGAPGTRDYTLRGTLAADAGKEYIRGALPDPALFCAWQFTQWLNARQIPVHGAPTTTRLSPQSSSSSFSSSSSKTPTIKPSPARRSPPPAKKDPSPPGPRLIATHRSAPLRDLLIPINHRSLNLDCECLLRTIGKGRARGGLNAIRRHLAASDLPLSGYEQTDGCGLSRSNMITPELLARANASFLTGPHAGHFLTSLPRLGSPGSTLRRLSTGNDAVIRAKSGTIERVKAYTGIIIPAEDRSPFIFAVLVNNYDGSYSDAVSPHLADLFAALGKL